MSLFLLRDQSAAVSFNGASFCFDGFSSVFPAGVLRPHTAACSSEPKPIMWIQEEKTLSHTILLMLGLQLKPNLLHSTALQLSAAV